MIKTQLTVAKNTRIIPIIFQFTLKLSIIRCHKKTICILMFYCSIFFSQIKISTDYLPILICLPDILDLDGQNLGHEHKSLKLLLQGHLNKSYKI